MIGPLISSAIAHLGSALIIAWLATAALLLVLPEKRAVLTGLAIGLACWLALGLAPHPMQPVAFLTAVLDPIPVMLILAIVVSLARPFGVALAPRAPWEYGLWLVVLLGLYATSFGVIHLDPYRFGYTPVGGGGVALALIIWAGFRRDVLVGCGALIGQALWTFGIGSSNLIDHVSHVLFLPVLIGLLAGSLFRTRKAGADASPGPASGGRGR